MKNLIVFLTIWMSTVHAQPLNKNESKIAADMIKNFSYQSDYSDYEKFASIFGYRILNVDKEKYTSNDKSNSNNTRITVTFANTEKTNFSKSTLKASFNSNLISGENKSIISYFNISLDTTKICINKEDLLNLFVSNGNFLAQDGAGAGISFKIPEDFSKTVTIIFDKNSCAKTISILQD